MPLSVATKVNIDTLRGLDAGKTYFLSSTTGQIKEASLMMRFKCWIGVSSARQKVANLVDAVRTTLLKSADATQNAALDTDIRTVNLKEMVKGSVIKDIASRFSAANEEKIAKAKADGLLNDVAKIVAINVLKENPGAANAGDLAQIARHALKPMLAEKLPMLKNDSGVNVLDEEAFLGKLGQAKLNIEGLLDSVVDSKALNGEKIDKHYAKHVIDTLFNKDGTRNGKTVDDLKTSIAVKVDFAFKLNVNSFGSNAPVVYNDLVKAGIDPEKKIAQILDFCGDDEELKEYVLEISHHLCTNSLGKPRSDEKIQNMIDAIKENLSEIRDIQKDFPGSAPALQYAMKVLDGSAVPNGMLRDIAAVVGNTEFKSLKNLNSFSKAEDIYNGMDELRRLVGRVEREADTNKRFTVGDEIGGSGPEGLFVKNAVVAFAMSKLGPGFMARLPNIMRGTEFGIMDKTIAVLREDMDTLVNEQLVPDRHIANNVLVDMGFVCTSVQEYSRLFIGQEIEVANVPPIDVGSVSSQNILDTLAASE